MAEAILKDQKRIMPACAYLEGEFGIKGYYMGVPCILGDKGVEKVVEFKLTEEEQVMFDKSFQSVKSLVDGMINLSF
jgi:malate dehydrogenase